MATLAPAPVFAPRRPPPRRLQLDQPPNLTLLLTPLPGPYMPVDLSGQIPARKRSASLYEASGFNLTLRSIIPPAPIRPDQQQFVNRNAVRRLAAAIMQVDQQVRPLQASAIAPQLLVNIANLTYTTATGVHTYDASTNFSGATSYAMSGLPDTGITFNTGTGVISIDTATASISVHGPFTITATNPFGSTPSNAFSITIQAAGTGNYHVDGPRVTLSTTAKGTTYGVSGPGVTRDAPLSEDLS